MRLSELIQQLTEIAEQLNPDIDEDFSVDPEVRLATQPSWPLASHVYGANHLPDPEADACPECPGIVWIGEGTSCWDSPYAPRDAWRV